MSLSEKQQKFAQMVAQLINFAFASGYAVTLGEAFRTPEQASIYAAQGKGIKNSLHCDRLAIDVNLFINGQYQASTEAYKPLGDFWKGIGGHWGGDFTRADGNHFEYRG